MGNFSYMWVHACVCLFLYPGGEGYRVTAQMVLVCCWRSMKEVAMLLGQLCQSLPLHFTDENSHSHQGLITKEQVRSECDEHTNAYFKTVPDIFLLCDMSTINTIFSQQNHIFLKSLLKGGSLSN